MVVYLALRAFGDSLISLALLEQLPPGADVTVLGSTATTRIAEVAGLRRFAIKEVLADVAAFHDLKRAGPARALADLRTVRRALDALEPDRVLFEHRDWRNRWIAPGTVRREPARRRSIYEDRRELLAETFGPMPVLAPNPRPRAQSKTLVVHPGARLEFKKLPQPLVSSVLDYGDRRGLRTILIDPERRHEALGVRAHRYFPAPSLSEAVAAVREGDLYVGADSFFLHLAHHFRIPAFAIVPEPSPYFALPGQAEAGALMTLARARDGAALQQALGAWIG